MEEASAERSQLTDMSIKAGWRLGFKQVFFFNVALIVVLISSQPQWQIHWLVGPDMCSALTLC